MDPKTWFNISRFFTLIGGFLTVLGGYGLYYFGQLKELKTNEAISKSEENAAIAKSEAAVANKKTAELELDVIEARKETAIANQKTESFRLNIEKARIEAEESKLKAEELKLEVEQTKLEAEELKLQIEQTKSEAEKAKFEREKLLNQQQFIKSMTVQITALIPTNSQPITNTNTSYPNPTLPLERAPLELSKPNEIHIALFFLHNYSTTQISENLNEIKFNFGYPEMQEQIIGKDLSALDGQITVDCLWEKIIEKSNWSSENLSNSNIEFKILVNGIIAHRITFKGETAENFIRRNRLNFVISNSSNNIKDVVLGNKNQDDD